MNNLVQILKSKIGNSFNQFSYIRSPLDTDFNEDSRVLGYCLLINLYSKNLAKYVRGYITGKVKELFETSACILMKNREGQGHNRFLP